MMTFLFDFFLEARAEMLLKKNVGILVKTMTPKEHLEINWPLVVVFEFDWIYLVDYIEKLQALTYL